MSQVVRIAAARDMRWLLRSRRAFNSPWYISLGLFLTMCCWLAPPPLLAQSVIPSNPALHHNPYALPRHDVEIQFDMAVSSAQLASENSVPTWTCMAFQSYRDGNWEVYARPSGATEPVRYTDDPASDAAPDVNRGCTHLVFESNRGVDGVYNIYSVALDGSGLAALTNSGLRSNHSPMWSPDGRQILFVSERTDNQDVFVMNADGSGQTQLTFAGEDDFSPTWSPDGRKILWVRQTSDTEGVLMLANADGSGEEALTSPLSYLRNPAYSNDAQWIAFDYDANADYWNDVGAMWVSPTAHGDDLMWHAGGNLADLWVNTWSPVEPDYDETMGLWERRSLIVSRVQYAIEDNRLVVQEIQLVDVVYGETYGTSYLDFDLAWRAADVTPPTVSFPRLPRYMPVYDPDLTDDPGIQLIHVSAADSGPSYLHRIDVEQVDSSGTVISGGMPGETVDMSLVTQPGATANIRARSVDAAGNASPWISRTTTGYSRIIAGSITDARAVPLSTEQLDLHFDPPAFLVRESPHGRFEALFPGLDATAAVWSTGTIYGNLDRQVPISALVTSFEAYMMPAEGMPNGIVNGSFSFSPATTEWVLRGPAVDLEMSGPSAPSIRFGDGTAPVVTTTSTLTQGVDMSRLGSEIHEPTLTFMYEISAGDATASAAQRRDLDVNTTLRSGSVTVEPLSSDLTNAFRVIVRDIMSNTQTIVFSNTVPTEGWIVGWADLEPWKMRSIDIVFEYEEQAGQPPMLVKLDDVSLGAWHTPVIHAVTPSIVPVAEGTTLTIEGENFIATPTIVFNDGKSCVVTWLSDSVLECRLPATLTPGDHRLRITNPSGHSSVSAVTLRVGHPVLLPWIIAD